MGSNYTSFSVVTNVFPPVFLELIYQKFQYCCTEYSDWSFQIAKCVSSNAVESRTSSPYSDSTFELSNLDASVRFEDEKNLVSNWRVGFEIRRNSMVRQHWFREIRKDKLLVCVSSSMTYSVMFNGNLPDLRDRIWYSNHPWLSTKFCKCFRLTTCWWKSSMSTYDYYPTY